jgi:HD superfamily phosphodiesterase
MNESIESLYDMYAVPANIRRHMQQVAKIAVFLAERLSERGIKIDVELVRRAAMLHDLFRIVDIREDGYQLLKSSHKVEAIIWDCLRKDAKGKGHAEFAYDFFIAQEPSVARIILAHAYSAILSDAKAVTWEEKVTTYADKCVMHDRIVDMKTRLEDGHSRYGRSLDSLKYDAAYQELEKELFTAAGIDRLPETITHINDPKEQEG